MAQGRIVFSLLILLALIVVGDTDMPLASARFPQPSESKDTIAKSRVLPVARAYLPLERKSAAPARNVVIMISDGWGYNHIEATSYFLSGQRTAQAYHDFPVRYAMSTFQAGQGYDAEQAWQDFDYVRGGATDSAAAATAMSTGNKTYSGAIGVDPDKLAVKHALEVAEALGKATGVVTSVQFSHATPAAFVAHNVDRGSFAEIANEMIYASSVDLIMGAGHPCYDHDGLHNGCTNGYQYVGGQQTWDDINDGDGALGTDANGDGIQDPWYLVQTRTEFQALASGPAPDRVLGIPQVYKTLQQRRSRGTGHEAPFVVPFNDSLPTLEEMTKAALNVLDDDPDGLFLMVEGGAVDWACHSNQSGRMIEEQVDFDQSVRAVVDWVANTGSWSETLLVVTGDHETGYLTGPGSDPGWRPIVNHGAGQVPGMEWHSESHTNSLIPLFALGDAARLFHPFADQIDPVRGRYIDNTELAQVLLAAMGSPLPH
jgi:alkaline phosphatase